MTDIRFVADPILVRRPEAAALLATSEKRIKELVNAGYISERFPDSHPRYLVTELAEYAKSLPTGRPA